jgi:hypothetical protein
MNYYVERSKTNFDSRLNRQQTSNHLSSPMPVPTQQIYTHAENQQMPEVRTTPGQTPHLITSHVACLAPTPSDDHIQEQMIQSTELHDETQIVGWYAVTWDPAVPGSKKSKMRSPGTLGPRFEKSQVTAFSIFANLGLFFND